MQQCCGHQLMHIRAQASEHWLGSGWSWCEEPGKKLRKTGATFSKLEPVSRQKKKVIFFSLRETESNRVWNGAMDILWWNLVVEEGVGRRGEVLWRNLLLTKFAPTWGEIWRDSDDKLSSAVRSPILIKVYNSWLQSIFSFWSLWLSFDRNTNQPITNISKRPRSP